MSMIDTRLCIPRLRVRVCLRCSSSARGPILRQPHLPPEPVGLPVPIPLCLQLPEHRLEHRLRYGRLVGRHLLDAADISTGSFPEPETRNPEPCQDFPGSDVLSGRHMLGNATHYTRVSNRGLSQQMQDLGGEHDLTTSLEPVCHGSFPALRQHNRQSLLTSLRMALSPR